MRRLLYLLTALMLVGIVPAADEGSGGERFWLNYVSSRATDNMPGVMNYGWGLRSGTPENFKVPDIQDVTFFYAPWRTPLAVEESTPILVAKSGSNYQIFVDSDQDKDFTDETALESWYTESYAAYFGPAKFVFDSENGPITYHLNLQLQNYSSSSPFVMVSTGCWYEGTVVVDGKQKKCLLLDSNGNGIFDEAQIRGSRDRIAIYNGNDPEPQPLAKYIEIDGQFYTPTVARDGSYVELSNAVDVKFGYVQVDDEVDQLTLSGENGYFQPLLAKERKIKVPVGKYYFSNWYITEKDSSGKEWRLGRYRSDRTVDVAENETAEIAFSTDLYAFIEVSRKENTYMFNRRLVGTDGEDVNLRMARGGYPTAPKLRIRDASGNYDKTFSLEYG